MDTKILTIDDFKKAAKKRERLLNIERRINKIGNVVSENKEILLFAIPMGCKAVKTVYKSCGKYLDRKREVNLKDLTWYDSSAHCRYNLKRKLTNEEKLALSRLEAKDRVNLLNALKVL